jgi:imidazolonepropionase-like amidohydrolase
MRVVMGFAVAAAMMAGGAQAKTVAVTAERLLDVKAGRYVDKPLIVVTDGRIVSVGRAGDAVPAGAERVDLPGVTLLPGLIDTHVHLTSSPKYGGYTSLEFSDAFWTAIATRHARDTLMAGFTTVRNVGSEFYGDVGLREAIDQGFVEGPRVITVTYSIGATGGHCDSTFFPPSMDEKSPYAADGPEAVRAAVRRAKKYGAQAIKICATGGVFSRGPSVGAQQMRLDEIRAVVEEAHMAGLKVAAHAHGADGIRAAVEGGVDTVEHVSLVDEAGIRLAVQKGTFFGMDIYNTDYTQAEGKKNGVLEDNLRKDREVAELQRENFRKSLRAGVRQIYSTDAGIYPHGQNAKQFAVMVRYGATPLQAIQAATVNAAEALGWSNDVGQTAKGFFGDLVGVTGDPLRDVTVLEKPVFVMKGGEVVRK